MPRLPKNMPISESVGVFIGITSLEWLSQGYAEPLKALAIALFVGGLLFLYRRRNDAKGSQPGNLRQHTPDH